MSGVSLAAASMACDADIVVHEIDLAVAAGEWVALIGPNGAGKTTVLRAVAGLVPYTGHISIGSHSLTDFKAKDLAGRIAFVPQSPQMPAGMSVAQYVLLGRRPHLTYFAREGAGDRRVVADVLDRLWLSALANRPLDRLSGPAMHDLTLAGQYADPLTLVVGGEVKAVGPPPEVLTEEVIGEHYRAQVRILRLPGAGYVVARSGSPLQPHRKRRS